MDKLRYCPTCGRPLGELGNGGQWQRRDGATFALGGAIPAGATWEKRSPARAGDLRGDLALPVGQAAVTALVGGVAGSLVTGLEAGAVIGAATFGVTWCVLLFDHRRALWTVERITGKDLDRDGAIGEPEKAEPPMVRVEVSEQHKGGQRLRWHDLPATERELADLATALFIKRQPFSRRELAGPGKPFSDPGFRALQAAMVDADLLWPAGSSPNAGYKLSPTGRQLLGQFLPGHKAS